MSNYNYSKFLIILHFIFAFKPKFTRQISYGAYVDGFDETDNTISLIFSLTESVGALSRALRIFEVSCKFIKWHLTETWEFQFILSNRLTALI